jgi:hypothetical protein
MLKVFLVPFRTINRTWAAPCGYTWSGSFQGHRMGRNKRNFLTFSPAHPTDLTLFVPLTISRGSFEKRGTCPWTPQNFLRGEGFQLHYESNFP